MANQQQQQNTQGGQGQQGSGTGGTDYVNVRFRRDHIQPVRDLVRNHLNELPSNMRNDIQTEFEGLGGGGGDNTARGSGR